MIQKLFAVFAELRSIKKAADKMNKLGYITKQGAKFNASTVRLLLRNPVYCVADENAYNYFYNNGSGLCEELSAFDGQHGISAYNKTDQEKFEYDDFFRATGYIEKNESDGIITEKLPVCDSDECCKHNMVLTSPCRMV